MAVLKKYVTSYGCVKCTAERVAKRDSSVGERYSKSAKGKATRKMYRLTDVSKEVQNRWVNKDYAKWPDKYKDRHLRNNYNITLSEYNERLAAQNSRCYICQTHVDELTRQLAVDHCHESGEIRKLLCVKCNTALGLVGDNISVLQRMISYLEDHQCLWH